MRGVPKSANFYERRRDLDPDQTYVIDRVQNTASVDQAALPPAQQGGQRVLNPTELEILYTENREGYTRFVLAWNVEPAPMLDYAPTFRVYLNDGQFNVGPAGSFEGATVNIDTFDLYRYSDRPPCVVILPGVQPRRVVFKVQTQLANGFVSDFETAPTVTGFADPIESEVRNVSGNYTCGFGDKTFIANASPGSFTITFRDINELPDGFTYTVKVSHSDVSGNNVVVQGSNTSQTIDGAATNTQNTASSCRQYRADKANRVWYVI